LADAHAAPLAHHFEDLEQQHSAVTFGMWVFLVTEVMFFGGMFTTYIVYRGLHPADFAYGSHELDVTLGTFNTAVLIGSSLTMALAVHAAQLGSRRGTVAWIAATIGLACVFLGVKVVEYGEKFAHHLVPGARFALRGTEHADAEAFFSLYFAMTGMHALHMIIGIGVMLVVATRAWRGRYSRENYYGVEVTGLYWHFVDLIWIFLFPLFYLLGRHVQP
jgi:cytochrome c oxidase subunit 3